MISITITRLRIMRAYLYEPVDKLTQEHSPTTRGFLCVYTDIDNYEIEFSDLLDSTRMLDNAVHNVNVSYTDRWGDIVAISLTMGNVDISIAMYSDIIRGGWVLSLEPSIRTTDKLSGGHTYKI